jgi:aminoglycoside phosphotransferase (APT) family kinase protein
LQPPDRAADFTARAVALVRDATGEDIGLATPLTSGRMTYKVAVETKRGRHCIVRIYPAGREHVADFEPVLLVRMRDIGMAVPKLLGWSGSSSPLPHLIYERLPGQSLSAAMAEMNEAGLERVCGRMMAQLALLASLPVNGFGDLTDGRAARHGTWAHFIREVLDPPLAPIADKPALRQARDVLKTFAAQRAEPGPPVLVWTDISPENVIVGNDGEFAGLIDFEGVMALEPAATLGYLQARYENTRFAGICDALMPAAARDTALAAIYTLVRALRVQPYLGLNLPAGGKRERLDEFLPGLRTACNYLIQWGARHHAGGQER